MIAISDDQSRVELSRLGLIRSSLPFNSFSEKDEGLLRKNQFLYDFIWKFHKQPGYFESCVGPGSVCAETDQANIWFLCFDFGL